MAEVFKEFGRYFLLDHIAHGEMAEIYRARLGSVDSAKRLLVIKCIQADYDAYIEFLQVFKYEIKVAMGLNHPNIVQLYDFGEEVNQPYIVMEFVDGRNLRQLMTRFNEVKQAFPIELAVHIIDQAARALHYAHSFRDKVTGNSKNVVHRDIAPKNLLISYEGDVKVIGFGLAKANAIFDRTRAGESDEKPTYLSPEQINGEQLDPRSDLFSLGTVLWELLCGKRLFSADSDLAVLKLIVNSSSHVKAPSTINSQVPKELDHIVLKLLSEQREERYQNGEELQHALHTFLSTFTPEFNSVELSLCAKDLFKNELVEDRRRIQILYDKSEQLLAVQAPS